MIIGYQFTESGASGWVGIKGVLLGTRTDTRVSAKN